MIWLRYSLIGVIQLNDGDRALVVADENIISIAERNMSNIVPLYYEMKNSNPVIFNGQSIYEGLEAAYTGGNIGEISNSISKIWNSGKIAEDELKTIKLLCAENNFVIDWAKTLYKPTRPRHIDEAIRSLTKSKLPHFFIYAKDKTESQVEPKNSSVVNRLDDIIKNRNLRFSVKEFGKFNHKKLMNNPNIEISNDLINEYIKLNREYHFKINMKDSESSNIRYIAIEIRCKLSEFGFSDIEITDMLVKYLYHVKDSKSKESLWFCYGDIIVENLKKNIDNKTTVCQKCGKRFSPTAPNEVYCDNCKGYQPIGTKIITCIDCGVEVEVAGNSNRKIRCDNCQRKKQLEYQRNSMLKLRVKAKM